MVKPESDRQLELAKEGVRTALWSCLGKERDLPTEGMWEPEHFPAKGDANIAFQKHCSGRW